VMSRLYLAVIVAVVFAVGGAVAHPTFYPRNALNPACDNAPQIFSFHIHILFWQNNNDSVNAAWDLRNSFMGHFNLTDTGACDDSNTTHPPTEMCMFEPDFPEPAGPFLTSDWAIFVPPPYYQQSVLWMTQHHGDLDMFVHPNSGCEIEDHTLWPLWGGKPWEIDISAFHYDCMGCSIFSCRASGERLMFSDAVGSAAACGLSETTNSFVLTNQTAFCQSSCQTWATDLVQLPVGCPHNCDLFDGAQKLTCQHFMNTLDSFDSWSKQCGTSGVTRSAHPISHARQTKPAKRTFVH